MLRVNKDQYDLVVIKMGGEMKEVKRWVYNRYIRESWPILKFNSSDQLAVRIMEANLTLELLSIAKDLFQPIQTLDQLSDHIHLYDYNHSTFIIVGLEQHDLGYKST